MIKVPRLNKDMKESIFCIDDCIATFAEKHSLIYQAMYLDEFIIDVQQMDKKYSLYFPDNMTLNLRKYGGILIETIPQSVCMMQALEEKLDASMIVMLEIKGKDCPWDWRYKKVDWGNHTFLLTGRNRNLFFGMDPYYGYKNVELPKKLLMSGFVQARVLSAETPNRNKLYEDACNKVRNYHPGYCKIEMLKRCINYQIVSEIKDNMISNNCFDDYNIENNDLIQSLQNCEYSRLRFAIFLQYLSIINLSIKQCISKYIEIAAVWGQIRKVAVKELISGVNNDETIVELLNQVNEMEKNILEKLAKCM